MSDASVAIVTGGAQGLGAAICKALLKKGYKVCVSDIQGSKGNNFVEEQKKEHGTENVIFCPCDVTKGDDYERLFDGAIKAFGRVDVLVNNAGIILEQDPRKTIEVNLIGPIIGCQTAFKYMGKSKGGKGGTVINTASIVGLLPYSSLPVYSASKHGVVGLTRCYGLPYHFEKEGILFAALCPFFIDTDLLKTSKTNTAVPGLDFSLRPDLMNPDYVAQGAIKLLEDQINGSTLMVKQDCGFQYVRYPAECKGIELE